jgi:hypothetical protein
VPPASKEPAWSQQVSRDRAQHHRTRSLTPRSTDQRSDRRQQRATTPRNELARSPAGPTWPRRSYQNEELILAIEQSRLRGPDDTWLIPVRFDDCEIPDRDIGGGRTLASIQRADLFEDRFEQSIACLTAAVLRIFGRQLSATSVPDLPHRHPANFAPFSAHASEAAPIRQHEFGQRRARRNPQLRRLPRPD